MTGVPPQEVGTIVQDFIDAGATSVQVVQEPGGTFSVDIAAGAAAPGARSAKPRSAAASTSAKARTLKPKPARGKRKPGSSRGRGR